MKVNRIHSLTPKEAWAVYVSNSVELFVSFFYADGFTDIADACKRYSRELPILWGKPFLQGDLDHIANLLERYIANYLSSIGGLSNLYIYTEDELDRIWQDDVDIIMGLLEKHIINPKPKGSCKKR